MKKLIASMIVSGLLATGMFVGFAPAQPPDRIDYGGMTPHTALEYMTTNADSLTVVDVSVEHWHTAQRFEGSVNIPIESLSEEALRLLFLDLPTDRPVLLHCRRGVVVQDAYETLKALRPDLPGIGFINGEPLYDAYNEWYLENA